MKDQPTGQRAAFEHFDRIAATKPGQVLLVCEPIKSLYAGRVVTLEEGVWIRVDAASDHSLYGKAAIEGRVTRVVIAAEDFASLEPKEA